MGKRRKKNNRQSDLPEVSPRKKPHIVLTGILEHSGAEIRISAKPEDWAQMRGCYTYHRDKLWSDLLPFMEVGYLNSIPKTKKHKDQKKKDSMKVFSAILYRFCESIKGMKQCPAFLKPLQNSSDCKDVAALLMDSVFIVYFKSHKFGHPYEDEADMYKVKMKPFHDKKDKMATDNFCETYIKGGLKLIKDTNTKTLIELIGEVNSILRNLHTYSNISSVSFDKRAHKILSAISDALYIQFRDPLNGTILKPDRTLTALEDIEFIRNVLRSIFPALPIPDKIRFTYP